MNKYSDIINLERPESNHNKMTIHDRSAQFAPFSALTGFNQIIEESSKYLENKKIIDNNKKIDISNKLNYLKNNNISISLTYFKNIKNNQGNYINKKTSIKKIDEYNKYILLDDNTKILFNDIYEIII